MLSLLEKQPDTDIVIASRNVPGGGVSQWSCWRRFISSSATCVSRLLLRQVLKGVRDPMSGYFLLRRPVIEGKVLSPLGYKILLEVLVKGNYRRAAELPYIFEERKKGGSKAGLRQYWMGFRHMLKLKKELRGY
jgi:dolichol-phosphate mannosyltransferase